MRFESEGCHPFVLALWQRFPEARSEPNESPDKALLHIEVGSLEQLSLDAFNRGDLDTVREHFAFVEQAIPDADAALLNALHVSYAEGFAWGSEYEQSARRLMPPKLAQIFDAMQVWPNRVDADSA